jgi:hypothetical protein
VVGCGHYHIVGDSLVHNSQKTILTIKTTSFVVKNVKQELRVDNIFLQIYNVLTSFIFIKQYDSSLGEELTPLPLLMELSKFIF